MATEPDQTEKAPSWWTALLVLLAGGVGGLLSWIYSTTSGGTPDPPPTAAIPALVALGGGAGFLGVFLFSMTDTRARFKCLAFALACGFAWKPVYEGTIAVIEKRGEEFKENKVEELAEQTETALAELAKASPDETAEKAGQVANLSREMLRVAGDVKNRQVYDRAVFTVDRAVMKLGDPEQVRSPERIAALEGIAETALRTGEVPIVGRVADTLTEVERSEAPPAVRKEATRALESVRPRLERLAPRPDLRLQPVRPTPERGPGR